jgi:hypothetical protein
MKKNYTVYGLIDVIGGAWFLYLTIDNFFDYGFHFMPALDLAVAIMFFYTGIKKFTKERVGV